MKCVIAGSRSITDIAIVERAIRESGFEITEVVCGCARGVDTLGEQWAEEHDIPVTYFPAEWERYGKSAGYRRNEKMAQYAQACIAVDAGTKGTGHMIDLAKRYGLKLHVHRVGVAR